MSVPGSPEAANRLLDLLPQIFRIRDREQALRIAAVQGFEAPSEMSDEAAGPLGALLGVLGQQLELLEAEVDWLYEDQFIETCADWAVPYIGALVGARIVDTGDARANRAQVANTIRNRRAKGTARALADRAAEVMGATAEALEYQRHVAHLFNPNFPGDAGAMTVAVNGPQGRALGLPWTIGQRLIELRDMREGGRFAPQNVGARIWTTLTYDHLGAVPSAADASKRRFRFDPLGRDIMLFTRGQKRGEGQARLAPETTPGPIPLIAAAADPGAYYGDQQGLRVIVDGTALKTAEICFCNLSDDPASGTWNERGLPAETTKLRIDPRLGRFVLASGLTAEVEQVRVNYRFGAPYSIGGPGRTEKLEQEEALLRALLGDRDRRPDQPIDFGPAKRVNAPPPPADPALKDALDDLAVKPAILVKFGGTLAAPAATALPGFTNSELRGGDGTWPTIMVPGAWSISGGPGSVLTLRGLRLFGGDLIIRSDGLLQISLIDCTLAPGSARLVIEEPGCKLLAVRSILGEVRVQPSVEIDLVDCIVVSLGADAPAIAALDSIAPGAILWAERSTIIGDARLLAIDEVSNSLFAERPNRTAAGPSVSVERLQSGCVRYCGLPENALVPRRYRCYPAGSDPGTRAPVFHSLDPVHPAYAALVPANPDPLLVGAENGGEMGVGNQRSLVRRKRLLDADLIEWVPFGMSAAAELIFE